MANIPGNERNDPIRDPARDLPPGGIDRDLGDPNQPYDPRLRPAATSSPRGLVAATLAVVVLILAVLAFSFIGDNGGTNQASAPAGDTTIEGGDNTETGSITPNGNDAEVPPIKPADPSEPVQPAPAQ